MRTTVMGVLTTVALSISTGAISLQESLSRAQGVMITRIVVSIEAGRGECIDLRGVMKLANDPQSGFTGTDLSMANLVDSTTVTLRDYTLQLTRADDRKRFQISLTPTVPNDNRPSWFSDDRGVIYTGNNRLSLARARREEHIAWTRLPLRTPQRYLKRKRYASIKHPPAPTGRRSLPTASTAGQCHPVCPGNEMNWNFLRKAARATRSPEMRVETSHELPASCG